MIVVDSSVWIGNLRNIETRAVQVLRQLDHDREQVLLGDLILLELLQGARSEAHAAQMEHWFSRFPIVSMLDPALAVLAARNVRQLRSKGVTVRKTIDVIIGTFCIVHGHHLLHDDRDFRPMVAHLGLLEV